MSKGSVIMAACAARLSTIFLDGKEGKVVTANKFRDSKNTQQKKGMKFVDGLKTERQSPERYWKECCDSRAEKRRGPTTCETVMKRNESAVPRAIAPSVAPKMTGNAMSDQTTAGVHWLCVGRFERFYFGISWVQVYL
jgi:hypothetical protein